MKRLVFWIVVGLICAGLLYVRFAPTDAARWHPVEWSAQAAGNYPEQGRFTAVREGSAEMLARLDAAARSTPRTKVIGGSVENGQITYETRSAIVGFPDYTSVTFKDNQLQVFGRLRFGRKDFGVNEKRVLGWLKAAGID